MRSQRGRQTHTGPSNWAPHGPPSTHATPPPSLAGMAVRLTLRRRPEPRYAQVFVKTFSGKTITIDAALNDTVYAFKKQIQAKEGVSPEYMRLIYAGIQLSDGALVAARTRAVAAPTRGGSGTNLPFAHTPHASVEFPLHPYSQAFLRTAPLRAPASLSIPQFTSSGGWAATLASLWPPPTRCRHRP